MSAFQHSGWLCEFVCLHARHDSPVVAMVSVHAQWVATHRILLQLPLVCFLSPAHQHSSRWDSLALHQLAYISFACISLPTTFSLGWVQLLHNTLSSALQQAVGYAAVHCINVWVPPERIARCSATHPGNLDCSDVRVHSISLPCALPCCGPR